MFTRYCRRPNMKSRRNRTCRDRRGDFSYAAILDTSRRNGITVAASQQSACVKISDPDQLRAETGILRYKNQWERKEADVFVNHQVLNGIPFFTEPDTLRVVSGKCSCVVPLEQITCIRSSSLY